MHAVPGGDMGWVARHRIAPPTRLLREKLFREGNSEVFSIEEHSTYIQHACDGRAAMLQLPRCKKPPYFMFHSWFCLA